MIRTRKSALYVDEWGSWYDQEPGSHPGFLYQQNSLRDAEVAALTLNIFHRHTDRVKLAAIAQMVNVLQAMILTDKDKMLLTPTYHVFDMYQPFMGATPYAATRVRAGICAGRQSHADGGCLGGARQGRQAGAVDRQHRSGPCGAGGDQPDRHRAWPHPDGLRHGRA